ncbi:MAG TPA: transcriptional regulator [Propionibacteriaceae bacterium]
MPDVSSPELLVLHGLRVKGMADSATVAERFALDRELVAELLLDYEALGWISRVWFADIDGWALTERGRVEDERRLAAELDETRTRSDVVAAHDVFVVLNSRFLSTITDWQIRPRPADRLAGNDHSDRGWDDRVLNDLRRVHHALLPVCERLTAALDRFGGYPERYEAALIRADGGERSWVSQPKIDSCHTVWMELHEDLLATLGLQRGG